MRTVINEMVFSRLEKHEKKTMETAETSRTYATERTWFDKGIN